MAFSYSLTSPGGLAPYTYSVGYPYALPSGLSIDSATGAITGTPTTAGAVSFKYTVVDSLNVLKNSSVCTGTGNGRPWFSITASVCTGRTSGHFQLTPLSLVLPARNASSLF